MTKEKGPVKNFFSSKYTFYDLLILFIIVFVSLIKVSKRKLILKEQANYYNEKIEELENENINLDLQIKRAKTKYFQEKAARMKFGLQKPGENVIIFTQGEKNIKTEEESYLKRKFSNIKDWWQYFFK